MGCILKGNSGLYSRMTRRRGAARGRRRLAPGRPAQGAARAGRRAADPAPADRAVGRRRRRGRGRARPPCRGGRGRGARVPDHAGAQPRRPTTARPRRCASACGRCRRRLDAVIVALADQPLIDAQDIDRADRRLQEARRRRHGGAAGAAPTAAAAGQPGDLRRRAARASGWPATPTWPAAAGASAHPERVHWFDTDNARYRIDIDTPEDLERFAASTGHVLQWPPPCEARHERRDQLRLTAGPRACAWALLLGRLGRHRQRGAGARAPAFCGGFALVALWLLALGVAATVATRDSLRARHRAAGPGRWRRAHGRRAAPGRRAAAACRPCCWPCGPGPASRRWPRASCAACAWPMPRAPAPPIGAASLRRPVRRRWCWAIRPTLQALALRLAVLVGPRRPARWCCCSAGARDAAGAAAAAPACSTARCRPGRQAHGATRSNGPRCSPAWPCCR